MKKPIIFRIGTRKIALRAVGYKFLLFVFAGFFLIWILLPIWFTVTSSFTLPAQIGEKPARYFPQSPTLDNYRIVFGIPPSNQAECTPGVDIQSCLGAESNNSVRKLTSAIANSLFVSTVLVILNLILATFAAYGLSRFPFRGSNFIFRATIVSRIVPGIVLIAPIFITLRVLGLLNTPWSLIIAYNAFTLPIAIILLTNYFDQIPRDIEEAAAVDGASRMQILRIILVPLVVPGLIATGVLVFLEAWSEFFFALVLTDALTVSPLLAGFLAMQTFNWTLLSAATVISLIPPVLLVLVFQRYVVSGLTVGAGK
jgi:ABC-type glycerol-3-phosphate transport system permease component